FTRCAIHSGALQAVTRSDFNPELNPKARVNRDASGCCSSTLNRTIFKDDKNKTLNVEASSNFNMSLDPRRLEKPLSKLRKQLKNFSKRPTPEQVHDL